MKTDSVHRAVQTACITAVLYKTFVLNTVITPKIHGYIKVRKNVFLGLIKQFITVHLY